MTTVTWLVIILRVAALASFVAAAANSRQRQAADHVSMMERVLSVVDEQRADCPHGSSMNVDFIHIGVNVSADQSPRELWCLTEDFDAMESIIASTIHSLGPSGTVTNPSGAPILFDGLVCPSAESPVVHNIFGRAPTRGNNRKLLNGWPFAIGAGGGCYSCATENCDDDTGENSNGCRRRRKLFTTMVRADADPDFLPVRECIAEALEAHLDENIRYGVECFQGLQHNQVFVDVTVKSVSLGEVDCSW